MDAPGVHAEGTAGCAAALGGDGHLRRAGGVGVLVQFTPARPRRAHCHFRRVGHRQRSDAASDARHPPARGSIRVRRGDRFTEGAGERPREPGGAARDYGTERRLYGGGHGRRGARRGNRTDRQRAQSSISAGVWLRPAGRWAVANDSGPHEERRTFHACAARVLRRPVIEWGNVESAMTRVRKVLIVDDEPPVRTLLARWLTAWGYAVREAATAQEALDIMAADPADIVLSDINMPEQDGLWLAEQVHARWPAAAIVMSTGRDDPEAVRKSRIAGAVGYVIKPFDPVMVRETV